ncbi:MAG: alpha/beta hydrolase [Lachnospiraceae bacterium]|nr:alpha/beta hydrolase [Lachnospiraceae bacterium]
MKRKRKIVLIPLVVVLALVVVFLAYCLPYYHAVDAPAFPADGEVKIFNKKDYIVYDGPGEKTAMVFYPGAKVDEKAYEALMYGIAEKGTDCFLVKMPFHLAIFGKNKAEGIIDDDYEYDSWIMGGHSLGGSMAAAFAGAHENKIDGLWLLASYSLEDLSDSGMKVISIYGSNDQVLNREHYEENKKSLPAETFSEKVIEGGNHAGFAYYGPQKGDGEAEISKEEQIRQTIEALAS